MSYLRDIPKPRCKAPGCDRLACYELVNRFNSTMGAYCARHGEKAKRELDLTEAEKP